MSSGERKRRRLNQMRVRGGGCCVFGVVGPCWILLPGGSRMLLLGVEQSGMADRRA